MRHLPRPGEPTFASTFDQASRVYELWRRSDEPSFPNLSWDAQNRWRVFAYVIEEFFKDADNCENDD